MKGDHGSLILALIDLGCMERFSNGLFFIKMFSKAGFRRDNSIINLRNLLAYPVVVLQKKTLNPAYSLLKVLGAITFHHNAGPIST